MNVIEIKGTVPGAGKTTALVRALVTANLPNKVLLCPSNKDRQVCIEKAINFGMDPKEAEKSIKTLRKFKKNYFMSTKNEESKPNYTTKHSEPHYGKIWNIFIDEASMVSKEEMDDLVKNWRILNLLLAGDSLQFDPVGNESAMRNGNTVIDEWSDKGLPYDLPANHQFLLNKSLRSIDPKLTKAINLVKDGKIIEAIALICHGRNLENSRCKYENTDWHTSYTNIACDRINAKYKNPRRYIITLPDNRYKFWESEILDIDDKRFAQLGDTLIMANAKDPEVPLFDEWLEKHAIPAYAVTSYKLQGTTISKDKIYIHVTDLLYGLKEKTDEQRAQYLQKHLYVAVSRATSADQIEFCGFGENPLIEDIVNKRHPLKKNDKGEYIPDLEKNEIGEALKYFESLMKPLVDESILEDAAVLGGDDENLERLIEDALEYDVATVEDVPQEYKDMISRAHSGPRKWTDEKLKSYTENPIGLRNELSKCGKTRREEILTRYTKLTGVVVPKETKEECKEKLSKAHSGEHKSSKWTDKKLLSYESIPSLMNALRTCNRSRREKLLARYTELRGMVIPEETKEERKERLSKAHSKPKKNGWADERIMSYSNIDDLKKVVKNYKKPIRERILNKWEELHNEEPKSNENVEKVQAVALITNTKEVEGVRRIEKVALQKRENRVEDELTYKPQSSKSYAEAFDDDEALDKSLDLLIQDSHSRVE